MTYFRLFLFIALACTRSTLYTNRVWADGDCGNDPTKSWTLSTAAPNEPKLVPPRCLPKSLDTGVAVACCAEAVPADMGSSNRTCAELGWDVRADISGDKVCGHSFGKCASAPSEADTMTYAAAASYCAAQHARLCTYAELLQGETKDTGCLYNNQRVWSSDVCRNCTTPGHLTLEGSGIVTIHPRQCTPDNTRVFVRCCGNVLGDCTRAGLGDGKR